MREQVEIVYCEITNGNLSYADYHANVVLAYYEQFNLNKKDTQEDIKMFTERNDNLKELQDELVQYFEIDMGKK